MHDLAEPTSGGTLSTIVVLAALVVVLTAAVVVCLWRAFTGAGERGWKALVPFGNVRLLLRIRGQQGRWFTLGLYLLPWIFVPVLAGAAPGRGTPARAPRAAWLAGLAAAVIVAGATVAYFLAPDRDSAPAGALTGQEQAAVAAAGTAAANLATYSRAHFDRDYARALAGTTGTLHSDVSKLKAQTKKTMTEGKFDLYAKVQHAALVGPATPTSTKDTRPGYVVLVALYGYTTTSSDTPNPQNLKVTVEKVKGKWLAADMTAVGIE